MKYLTLVLMSLGLVACGGGSSNSSDPLEGRTAVVVGTTADFSSSSHSTIEVEAPFMIQSEINASALTDVSASAFGDSFYRINRFGGNSVIHYKINDPDTPVWECSTEGADTQSNPYQVIQVSDTKAYLLRYGAGSLWIINPSITDSSECDTAFKTGEIDLSAFDPDGVPEMVSAVAVGGRLFVAMQRLTFFSPDDPGLVVVINTRNNTIIDVDPDTAGTQAITLTGHNPLKILYDATLDTIFVQSVGTYASFFSGDPAITNGGIDTIDPDSYAVSQLVDDDASTTQISDMAIVDGNGYFVSYAAFGDNSLRAFNLATGEIESEPGSGLTAIAGLANINIRTTASLGEDLWVGLDSGVTIIDTNDNSVTETLIDTKMNPSAIVFPGS